MADELWETLEPQMRASRVAWTLFSRDLTYLVRDVPGLLDTGTASSGEEEDLKLMHEDLLTKLIRDDNARAGSSPFYEELTPDLRSQWLVGSRLGETRWLRLAWRNAVRMRLSWSSAC